MEYKKLIPLAVVVLFLVLYFAIEIRNERFRKKIKVGDKAYYYSGNKKVKGVVKKVIMRKRRVKENGNTIDNEQITFIQINEELIHVQNVYKI